MEEGLPDSKSFPIASILFLWLLSKTFSYLYKEGRKLSKLSLCSWRLKCDVKGLPYVSGDALWYLEGRGPQMDKLGLEKGNSSQSC